VWLSGEVLTVAYEEEALAQYRVGYAAETRLFATRHASPQPFLAGLGDVEWHPAMQLRPFAARRQRHASDDQLRLVL
jgi:hypothetical protein